jgi:hypothetical protein
MIRHTSKALKPLETERTDGVAGEENGTLYWFVAATY